MWCRFAAGAGAVRGCTITVVTSCSKRKRVAPLPVVSARALAPGKLETVASDWEVRVSCLSPSLDSASALYCGRQFQEASGVAKLLQANLVIISAGLGAIPAAEAVIPYSLTIARGAEDNVLTKVEGMCEPADWWRAITSRSGQIRCLRAALGDKPTDLLLFAMPSSYLRMIEKELSQFSDGELSRVRVFTAPSFRFSDDRLTRLVVPYDNRLDGPDSTIAGTATDFSARALRDFAAQILPAIPDGDADDHARAVSDRLQNWRMPLRPDRQSQTDEQLLATIRASWGTAGGSASQMLRYVRLELGLACEQARMRSLYDRVFSEMEELS